MSTIQFTSENMDIRDINPGEVYFAIASKANGGRCVNNGCFRAVWRTKAEAKTAADGNPDYTVVKCLKPEGGAY
jgi:hypothetical protein